ncbi:hypothetical protein MML48_9g00006859 [Holotrichia oblita]|uniref:Uncharacterized protein n=1 Tax=Holotrichia oblita TaxID=644536 RepID=A0ACB9SLN2_HOLOL|nr:hypothetical protein MML48_9g00006859 [Holotrichia oblita]
MEYSSIIKWPDIVERNTIIEKFKSLVGMDGVVGVIDGTYVPIKAPKQNAQQNVNRKHFHAITLQVIAAPTLKFLDCFAGYPSSVSDIRVFRNSPIFQEFVNNNNRYFRNNEYILGDKAYPLYSWCLPPYIDRGQLNEVQTYFNSCHARTRQVVERSFSLLFGRFRRLRNLHISRTDLIPKTILACCVLHNICLLEPDLLIQEYIDEGRNVLQIENINNAEEAERNVEVNELRNQLANNLYNNHMIELQIYRIPKHLTEELGNVIIPYMRDNIREVISVPNNLKIFIALQFFGYGSYQKITGQDYHTPMSQASVNRCLTDVITALEHLSHLISFPTTQEQCTIEKQSFMEMNNGFPGIIGCVDCTHISIIAPPIYDAQFPFILFLNRKGYYSLNVQIICNSKLRILAINARFPGSVHDSAIWQTSQIRATLQRMYLEGNTNSWLLDEPGNMDDDGDGVNEQLNVLHRGRESRNRILQLYF